MISITIDDKAVKAMLAGLPGRASRAAEKALDFTAREIWKETKNEMKRVFASPTPWTLRNPQYTKTRNHNMEAKVYYTEPERMTDHYLTPQVEGGRRKLKGFEKGVGLGELTPALGARIDKNGNVSVGQIKQILSIIGRAETHAGYDANATKRSVARGNERDYVVVKQGNKGHRIPGVYQRFAKTSVVRGKYSTLDRKKGRAGGAFAWQTGSRKAVVRARGLRPVFLQGRTGHSVQPLFPFYKTARATYDKHFIARFTSEFKRLAAR